MMLIMEWMTLVYKILEVCIVPLLGILTTYFVKYVKTKSLEIQNKIDNDTADKYIRMADETISSCVIAVTQTYVDALKKENAFTKEAQKEAFKMAYNSVMSLLTVEAKDYLTNIYGDLSAYIATRIEAEVQLRK
jgi:hypothetical protein